MTHSDADESTLFTASSTAGYASRSLEVSNAVARLHKQYIGRGPASVRTTIDGDLVVVLLEGGYTRAEQTLGANDMGQLVETTRQALQDAMRAPLVDAVRTVLGREVASFMSASDVAHGLQVEIFVLAPGDGGSAGQL